MKRSGRVVAMLVIVLLSAACAGYLESAAPTWRADPGANATLPPIAPGAGSMAASAARDTELSDTELIALGGRLYATNCAPCHHPNGEGNLNSFPALNRNPFVTVSDPTGVIDTVLHGRNVMPAFAPTLSAQETAAVLSYIRNAWNNEASVVNAQQVREVQGALPVP